MKRRCVRALVGLHRALFTGGTALLGVGGSLVATHARVVANWALLLGAAVLMYFADRCADIDRDARVLARSSNKPLADARWDMWKAGHPRIGLLALGVGLLCAWGGLTLADGASMTKTTSAEKRVRRVTVPRAATKTTKAIGKRPPATRHGKSRRRAFQSTYARCKHGSPRLVSGKTDPVEAALEVGRTYRSSVRAAAVTGCLRGFKDSGQL